MSNCINFIFFNITTICKKKKKSNKKNGMKIGNNVIKNMPIHIQCKFCKKFIIEKYSHNCTK